MRPNSGEVQESAEREALAKVIKHKGKDRQLDKTVIIKNTPEAFRSDLVRFSQTEDIYEYLDKTLKFIFSPTGFSGSRTCPSPSSTG